MYGYTHNRPTSPRRQKVVGKKQHNVPFLQAAFSFFGVLGCPEVVACLQNLSSMFQNATLNDARQLGNKWCNQPDAILASITASSHPQGHPSRNNQRQRSLSTAVSR